MEELLPILLRIASALERQNELAERILLRDEERYQEQVPREKEHLRLRQAEMAYVRLSNRAAAEGMAQQLQHTLDLIYGAHQRGFEEEIEACGRS